jgi:hypothetical protein
MSRDGRAARRFADPVEVLFSVQPGGRYSINEALAYRERLATGPACRPVVLISDPIEGGTVKQMPTQAKVRMNAGVNVSPARAQRRRRSRVSSAPDIKLVRPQNGEYGLSRHPCQSAALLGVGRRRPARE